MLAAAWAAMSLEGKPVVARREIEEVERIIGGESYVPAAVGTFREASTPEGGAAPWPLDLPADQRNTRALSPTPSAAGSRRADRVRVATGAALGASVTALVLRVRERRRAARAGETADDR